jgi:hypothetical protein
VTLGPNLERLKGGSPVPVYTIVKTKRKKKPGAHACNSSYSGGKDQEDLGLKPAWVNSSRDPILKNPSQKYGWWSGSSCRL